MRLLYVFVYILFSQSVFAQKYKLDKSTVIFFSEAAVENIAATNEKSVSRFDISTGAVAFIITNQDFEFEKSLMKEHFNEKYMESDKFPKSTFQGLVSGYDPGVSKVQTVTAKGKITIHGQSKEMLVSGTMQITAQTIQIKAEFIAELNDFKIKIPKLLWQNIAERVEVKLDFIYKPL